MSSWSALDEIYAAPDEPCAAPSEPDELIQEDADEPNDKSDERYLIYRYKL